MAVTYAPFDAGAGANVNEATWQKFARRFLATGVIRSYLNQLAVTADGTTLGGSVASGGAWIEGFYYESDEAIAFTVTTAHATLGRIDRVILRLDRTANTITQVVLAGTAAASPVAPTLTVTDTLWEIGLATVLVDPAVGVIAANKVTDTRTLVQNGQRFVQGLAANLPTVRQQGLVYYATDTDVLYYDDGTATHIFPSTATADAAYTKRANNLSDVASAATALTNLGADTAYVKRSQIQSATILTGENSTSSAFVDLATSGPAVTVTVGASGTALVSLSCSLANSLANTAALMSVAVSGATTVAAADTASLLFRPPVNAGDFQGTYTLLLTGLTAGSNTFTAKYRVTGGTGTWSTRRIVVIPT